MRVSFPIKDSSLQVLSSELHHGNILDACLNRMVLPNLPLGSMRNHGVEIFRTSSFVSTYLFLRFSRPSLPECWGLLLFPDCDWNMSILNMREESIAFLCSWACCFANISSGLQSGPLSNLITSPLFLTYISSPYVYIHFSFFDYQQLFVSINMTLTNREEQGISVLWTTLISLYSTLKQF